MRFVRSIGIASASDLGFDFVFGHSVYEKDEEFNTAADHE
jgi:hypothetical protein